MDNDTPFAGEGAVANPSGSDPRARPESPAGRPHFTSGLAVVGKSDFGPRPLALEDIHGPVAGAGADFTPRHITVSDLNDSWLAARDAVAPRYFLIQRYIWPSSPPLYYAVVNGRFKWSAKIDEAIRVSRSQDAEALKATLPSPLVGQISVLECVGA